MSNPGNDLPLIAEYAPGRPFAWLGRECISAGQALGNIQALVKHLDPGRDYFNLCADRSRFTAAFAAVCLAGGSNLLPASLAPGALAGARRQFADAEILDDEQIATWLSETTNAGVPDRVPRIPAAQRAAVVFTSGSTGAPVAHAKYWRDLYLGTQLFRQFFFNHGEAGNVVASVPPQHMYGLEMSVLAVLGAGVAAHAQCPSMPWDIAAALAQVPEPRLLIATPVHLDACLRAGVSMPALSKVISATAPLSAATARAAESAWGTPVYEVYGCSETGSIAGRRTSRDDAWTLYDGMQLDANEPSIVRGPQLPGPVRLGDRIQRLDEQHFRLLGRAQDMLKLAGKRLSLGELTQRLLGIDGVIDAVAFLPSGARRPAALVVAPELPTRQIAAQLAAAIDPVFVPRPLLRVARLPRNAVGKLPRAELEALLKRRKA